MGEEFRVVPQWNVLKTLKNEYFLPLLEKRLFEFLCIVLREAKCITHLYCGIASNSFNLSLSYRAFVVNGGFSTSTDSHRSGFVGRTLKIRVARNLVNHLYVRNIF